MLEPKVRKLELEYKRGSSQVKEGHKAISSNDNSDIGNKLAPMQSTLPFAQLETADGANVNICKAPCHLLSLRLQMVQM